MSAVIEVEGLRKEYRKLRGGKTVAVHGLDMSVPQGGVFGFLGPNGSGKTTTIRCLLGLVRATAGRTRLLGADRNDLSSVMHRVGSLVEQPTFFPTMSGHRNLVLLAMMNGISRRRVDEMLELVGLGARGDDMFKTYSLGMKQRLGIAAALLKDPELLILDEPANGLDPAGIKEIRELLRRLGSEGRTVFVSSHLLNEVQQMCDSVVIISHGRHVVSGAVSDVLTRGAPAGYVVKVDNLERAARVLIEAGFDASHGNGAIHVRATTDDASRITRALSSKRLYLSELRPVEVSLESVFLELTTDAPEMQP